MTLLNWAWGSQFAAISRLTLVFSLGVAAGCFQPDAEDRSSVTDNILGNTGGMNGGATAGGANGAASGGASTGGTGGAGSAGSWPGACKERWNPGEDYHPPEYAEAAVHGTEAKLQVQACGNCHGDTLEGCGGATTCDSCHDGGHPAGWRENCTYCHGGAENDSGAPPTDLDRTTAATAITFTAHTRHMTGDNHLMYDCNQCHTKPKDVLSVGHMVDATKGTSEVNFSAGLSPDATFDGPGTGSCKNNYCHGSGLEPGDFAVSEGPATCESCHGTTDLKRLSFDHDRHTNTIRKFEAIPCASCHSNTDKDNKIIDPTTHVDGKIDVAMKDVTWDPAAKTCTGTCHTSYPHTDAKWEYEAASIF